MLVTLMGKGVKQKTGEDDFFKGLLTKESLPGTQFV